MNEECVIVHGGALGDVALTIRLALLLRDWGRESPLVVVSRTNPGELLRFRPAVRWLSADALETHWLFRDDDARAPLKLEEAVRGRLVLNALGECGGPIHARLCGLGARRVLSFDPRPRDGTAGHIVEQWISDLPPGAAAALGAVAPALVADEEFLAECRKELGERIGWGARVLIHPGSGGAAKCWPLMLFVSLAKALRRVDCGVAMIIGPTERERWRAGEIEAARDEGIRVFEPRDASELVRLLVGCDLFIGNDSGPAHLAALVGRPTVTLFGPTLAARWGPLASSAAACRAIQGDAASPAWGIEPSEVLKPAATAIVCGSGLIGKTIRGG